MTTAQFIREKSLIHKEKYLGRIFLPSGDRGRSLKDTLKDTQERIFLWIDEHERKFANNLGNEISAELEFRNRLQKQLPIFESFETKNRSLVECAMVRNAVAVRYFHFTVTRHRQSKTKYEQVHNEGFLTSFILVPNLKKRKVDLWIKLDYCHVPERRSRSIPPSTPRVVNSVLSGCSSAVPDYSDCTVLRKEFENVPHFDSIEKVAKDQIGKKENSVANMNGVLDSLLDELMSLNKSS